MGRIMAICMAAAVMACSAGCGENPGKGTNIQDEVLVASESVETEESVEGSAEAVKESKAAEDKKENKASNDKKDNKKDNKASESKADSKASENKADNKKDDKADNKASESKTEDKPAESKPVETKTENKASESKTETKTDNKDPETKTESKPAESAPASENKTESAPAAPTTKPAEPAKHEHSWNETGRTSSTDCFAGKTTTTISYSCSCGETKTETQTADSGCVWEWVGETTYDNSGCIKSTISRHICTVHGTATSEMPKMETVDEHNYVENRIEPSCECEGFVTVTCSKCGMHFPDKSYSLGGGQGHTFVESSRRPLSQDEAEWYEGQGKSACVTYTCSTCGFSYDEME